MSERILAYARQRGIEIDQAKPTTVDESQTVGDLLAQAQHHGVPGVNTKTRKGALVTKMREFFNARSVATVDIETIIPKLTPRQRRRAIKKGDI